nr:IS66 family transposase [Chondromyces crocatus]
MQVRRQLTQLADRGCVTELIEHVLGWLTQLTDAHHALTLRLQTALRALYGRKSQKVSSQQLSLWLTTLLDADEAPASQLPEAPPDDAPPEKGEQAAPPADPPKPPKRAERAPLPAHLERHRERLTVPASERVCGQCGRDKACIGYRTSEVLDFIPARFIVVEQQREKLACPRCPEQGVSTAPPDKVMDRGRPGPGLLAKLVVDKFEDSMPLYRQAQACARSGVVLSSSTLGDWTAFTLDLLAPIAARITERVLAEPYLRTDDTGIPVQDRKHPRRLKRGHLWVFVGDHLASFLYAPDWKAKHPAALLQPFQGFLQGDGYAGYNAMLRQSTHSAPSLSEERRLGCGMHIRAKFEKAAKLGDLSAAIALGYFKGIYLVEAECKARGFSPEQRHAYRQAHAMPLVDALFQWVRETHKTLVPKTPLYEATFYAKGQEAAWRRCFSDGRFEIDNGEAERQLRKIAVGRKNFLFAGSDKGAERLAIGFTLFRSCSLQGVNPLLWATDVITKLQRGWPRSRLDELLPDAWSKAHTSDATAVGVAAS